MARIPPVATACIAAIVAASLVVSIAFAAEGPDGATAPDLAASAVTVLYVDRYSVGGRCSNARSAAQAASPRTPWCSLKRAVAAAPSGSTVLVRAGRYPELEVEDDRHRSTWVTLRRYPSER